MRRRYRRVVLAHRDHQHPFSGVSVRDHALRRPRTGPEERVVDRGGVVVLRSRTVVGDLRITHAS
jgi:hypothetical protein